MDSITEKRCSKCKEVKKVSEFFRLKESKDGYKSNCKACSSEYNAEYKAKNKDKVLLSHRLYNLFHKDEINQKSKKRNEENPEKRKELTKKSYWKNVEKIKEIRKLFKKEHPDIASGYQKKYRESHLEEVRERSRIYAKKNLDRDREKKAHHENQRRSRKKQAGGSFTLQEWRDLCNKYDNRCLCCGEQKPLTRDHVIPISLGGDNYITNIQPLCLTCNCSKHDKVIDYR